MKTASATKKMNVKSMSRRIKMSKKRRKQKLLTFRGTIENVKPKNTRSGLSMVVFAVNSYPFKAFGSQAETVKHLDGHYAEITATHNTFKGKDEYAVASIHA